jgi:uncharacterized protein YutE (UPF0331/DUF86 family)
VIGELANHDILTEREWSAVRELYKLRNSIVHGAETAASDADVARLLDLIWRFIRRLA